MQLEVKNAHYTYQKNLPHVLQGVDLSIKKGTFVGVIGPNGSGKTTLLKAIYRAIELDEGCIFLDNQDINQLSQRDIALNLGVVTQQNDIPFDFTVKDIVLMGRSPHKTWMQPDTVTDHEMVLKALKQVNMENKINEDFHHLSGGEQQRVMIARVLAQQAQFLILDEPTNHLDIKNQLELFDFIKGLKITVLAAMHDLNMAALYCDELYVISQGKIIENGIPEKILTPTVLKSIFGVSTDISIHPKTKKPFIVYLPKNKV